MKLQSNKTIRCAVAALTLITALPAGALELAAHGHSDYAVVIPAAATPMEKYAANELTGNLEKAAKVSLPIVSETAEHPAKAIYIGNTALAQAVGLGGELFAPEEFEIRVQGDAIIIAGSPVRGTLFGVYEFLEKAAGVHFLAFDCTFAPEQTKITVSPDMQIRRKPAIRFRSIYVDEASWQNAEWQKFTRRAGFNQYGHTPELGFTEAYGKPRGCHAYFCYAQDLPLEHSWTNKDGKRVIVNDPTYGAICYTDPAVLDHFEKKLRGYIEADRKEYAAAGAPAPVFYCVDCNDGPSACFCPECQKFIAGHGVSGLVVDFTNRLGDHIKADYPEVKLMIFAYHDALQVPKSGIRAHDNVIVRLTAMDNEFFASEIPCDVMRSIELPGNQEFLNVLDSWSKAAKNLAAWGYWRMYRDESPSPQSNAFSLAGLIRKYHALGIQHYFVEMELDPAVAPSFFELRFYMGGKLMNNPDLDDQKLIDDFMNGYYGQAAPEMRKILELLESSIANEPKPLGLTKLKERVYLNNPEFYRTANSLFEAALGIVPADSAYRKRIEQERLPFDLAYLLMAEKIGNPLGDCRAALVERSRKAMQALGEKYPWKKAEVQENGEKLLKQFEKNVSVPSTFAKYRYVDLLATQLRGFDQCTLIADPDAAGGSAWSIGSRDDAGFHKKPLRSGIYDFGHKETLAEAADEKYHFYYLGRGQLYQYSQLWVHGSWQMRFELSAAWDGAYPAQLFDYFISVKRQGVSYVKGSQLPDDVRIDRVIFVKVNKNDPVTPCP